MKFEQYVKEYRKEMERLGIQDEDITDGELTKMFLSHSVIRDWDNEQQKKKRMEDKKLYKERMRRRDPIKDLERLEKKWLGGEKDE